MYKIIVKFFKLLNSLYLNQFAGTINKLKLVMNSIQTIGNIANDEHSERRFPNLVIFDL